MMTRSAAAVFLMLLGFCAAGESVGERPPETVYEGELIRFPGAYAFQIPREHIILVSDQELRDLSDPDKVVNLTLTFDERKESLRQVCERGQARGSSHLILAFDHFFKQYRPGQDAPRELTCDMPEFIERVAAISKFAEGYGMGLELSLLSPLEIGPAFLRATGESGTWMHYRKGLRDAESGAYSVQLWRQQRWVNNKGPIDIEDAGIRVFAFREQRIGGTPYREVRPEWIKEITDTAQVEVWPAQRTAGEFLAQRIRVYGEGGEGAEGLTRVLVVQSYRVPEMDYFSPRAKDFLHGLADAYAGAGVRLDALYSDEMHIQQDWGYFNHHDHGEFALRYVSDGFQRAFAERYGAEYADFAKYLVYFTHGQEDFRPGSLGEGRHHARDGGHSGGCASHGAAPGEVFPFPPGRGGGSVHRGEALYGVADGETADIACACDVGRKSHHRQMGHGPGTAPAQPV